MDTLAMMWSTGRWSSSEEDTTSPLEPRKVKGGRATKTSNKAAAVGRPTCPFQAGSVVVASFGEIDLRLSWRTGSSSSYVYAVDFVVCRESLGGGAYGVVAFNPVMKCTSMAAALPLGYLSGVQLCRQDGLGLVRSDVGCEAYTWGGVGDLSRYVWPVGFRSRRLYTSKYHKDKRVWCLPVAAPPHPTHSWLIIRLTRTQQAKHVTSALCIQQAHFPARRRACQVERRVAHAGAGRPNGCVTILSWRTA